MKRVGYKLDVLYDKQYDEIHKYWYAIDKFIHLKKPVESELRNIWIYLFGWRMKRLNFVLMYSPMME